MCGCAVLWRTLEIVKAAAPDGQERNSLQQRGERDRALLEGEEGPCFALEPEEGVDCELTGDEDPVKDVPNIQVRPLVHARDAHLLKLGADHVDQPQ